MTKISIRNLFQWFFSSKKNNEVSNTPTANQEIKQEQKIESIMLPSNMIKSNSVCVDKSSKENFGIYSIKTGTIDNSFVISITVDKTAIQKIESLVTYFEITPQEVFQKSIWALSLIKDIEITDKKVGIISLDEQNIVTDVSPINVV